MRVTQRLQHLSEAADAASERWGDTAWTTDEIQAIALAVAMIDQVILGREEREGAPVAHAVPLSLPNVEESLTARIDEHRRWIEDHGGDLNGYVMRYGSAEDPEHFGDGGEAIFAADRDALKRLIEERARLRHPSQTGDES